MKPFPAAVIFAAGYVLGRPEGRAKLAELLQRPEVAQLKQQAASTASTAAKSGRQQLATATQKIKNSTTEKRAEETSNSSNTATDGAGSRHRLRLSRFTRRGTSPGPSPVPAALPSKPAAEALTNNASTTTAAVNDTPAAGPTARSATPLHTET